MNFFYLDTNIFIYLADKHSPYHRACVAFIKQSQQNNLAITTSVETFQEIIHYAKNTKQLSCGIKIATKTKKLLDAVFSINEDTIDDYLKLVKKYKNVISRDILHLAVALENRAVAIITYDKEFAKFREIKSATPDQAFKAL